MEEKKQYCQQRKCDVSEAKPVPSGGDLAILALEEGDSHLGSHLYICISFSPPSAAGRDALAADPHLLLQQISHQIQPGGTTNREREESASATHLFLLMMLISSNIKVN